MTPAILGGLFVATMCGIIGSAVYGEIKFSRNAKARAAEALEKARNFILSLSERQRALHEKWRGENPTHIIMSLEQRIYELEQRLLAHERLHVDDGK